MTTGISRTAARSVASGTVARPRQVGATLHLRRRRCHGHARQGGQHSHVQLPGQKNSQGQTQHHGGQQRHPQQAPDHRRGRNRHEQPDLKQESGQAVVERVAIQHRHDQGHWVACGAEPQRSGKGRLADGTGWVLAGNACAASQWDTALTSACVMACAIWAMQSGAWAWRSPVCQAPNWPIR